MNEPEEKDHWKALAEELGLPPESPETPPTSASPESQGLTAAVSVETSQSLASPSSFEQTSEAGDVPGSSQLQCPSSVPEASSSSPRLIADEEERAEVVLPEESTETVETPEQEERPRRRRRTRSSKKSRKRTEAETTDTATEIEKASEEERPRRRRRRRSKKTDKESEASSDTEKEQETPSEETPRDEEDDEEIEDFSTWNVPSWAEIIDGLYRPEN